MFVLMIRPFVAAWLFQRKNFAAAAVFSQIDAAWLQGQKKNFVKLPFDFDLKGIYCQIHGRTRRLVKNRHWLN